MRLLTRLKEDVAGGISFAGEVQPNNTYYVPKFTYLRLPRYGVSWKENKDRRPWERLYSSCDVDSFYYTLTRVRAKLRITLSHPFIDTMSLVFPLLVSVSSQLRFSSPYTAQHKTTGPFHNMR